MPVVSPVSCAIGAERQERTVRGDRDRSAASDDPADDRVTVDMGQPRLDPADIPFLPPSARRSIRSPPTASNWKSAWCPWATRTRYREWTMWNTRRWPICPLLERHDRFPQRANIGFMQVVAPDQVGYGSTNAVSAKRWLVAAAPAGGGGRRRLWVCCGPAVKSSCPAARWISAGRARVSR